MPEPRSRQNFALVLPLGMLLAVGPVMAQEDAPSEAPLPPTTGTVSVYSMLEIEVLTAGDENLGQVYDLIADPIDGLLKFLVVERTEDILGMIQTGETRVAIPWHRVTLTDSPRRFVIDLTVEEFERMPTWEGERTEGGAIGAAPIDERPDQPALTTD